jgi:guanylate kinase
MINKPQPLLIILSAPSGTGKTTLCHMLTDWNHSLVRSISCTTRPPRGHEVHGKDYYFISEDEFEKLASENRFLEHANVHGYMYGTLKDNVLSAWANNKHVILVIDVQGARQVREAFQNKNNVDLRGGRLVDIFIAPPSLSVAAERIRARGEDSEEAILQRIKTAESEIAASSEYKYIVVNDSLQRAFDELKQIIEMELSRSLH